MDFNYQRQVIAFHGCDRDIRDQVLLGKAALRPSENDYDWLGRGLYFWEFGPERAIEWAQNQKRRGRIKKAAVLGAYINLGHCFDLLDTRFTRVLGQAYPDFETVLKLSGNTVPENVSQFQGDSELLLRKRDCAVINWALDRYQQALIKPIDTVRGVFQEGQAAFPGAFIKEKSHIQIAVREPACIIGYFRP